MYIDFYDVYLDDEIRTIRVSTWLVIIASLFILRTSENMHSEQFTRPINTRYDKQMQTNQVRVTPALAEQDTNNSLGRLPGTATDGFSESPKWPRYERPVQGTIERSNSELHTNRAAVPQADRTVVHTSRTVLIEACSSAAFLMAT